MFNRKNIIKNIKILFAAVALSAIGASVANVAPFDWMACNAETAKFCPAEKDDEKIYACLHAHDADLSPTCDKQNTAYEAKTGKPQ